MRGFSNFFVVPFIISASCIGNLGCFCWEKNSGDDSKVLLVAVSFGIRILKNDSPEPAE